MNYIDLIQKKVITKTKNNTVVVEQRSGIQGPAGENGLTPTIDPTTYHWIIGDVDTGIIAIGKDAQTPYINSDNIWCIGDYNSGVIAGIPEERLPEIMTYDSVFRFPVEGNTRKFYIDTSTDSLYYYEQTKGYCKVNPVSPSDVETASSVVSALNVLSETSDFKIDCGTSDTVIGGTATTVDGNTD